MYRNILVPIDGSDTAKRGLREAMILAKGNGTTLRLIHVVNTAVIALEYAETYAPTDDWSEGRRVVGEAALKEAEDIVKQNGLHSESVMLESAIELEKRINARALAVCKELDKLFPLSPPGGTECVKEAVNAAMPQAKKAIAAAEQTHATPAAK